MTTEATIALTVTLPNDDVAWQLAQFCKRSTYNDFYELTEAHLSPDERKAKAYQMIAGIDAVARALHQVGIEPR
jgi:hypothetical protein